MEATEDDLIARVQERELGTLSPLLNGEEPALFAIRQLMPRLLQALLAAGLDPNWRRHELDEPLLNEAILMWEEGPHGRAGEAVPLMIDAPACRRGHQLEGCQRVHRTARGGASSRPQHLPPVDRSRCGSPRGRRGRRF